MVLARDPGALRQPGTPITLWSLAGATVPPLLCPQLFLFRTVTLRPPHNFTQCTTRGSFPQPWHETLYNMLGFACLFLLPLLIMLCCYARILLEISRRMGSGLCECPHAWGFAGTLGRWEQGKPRPGCAGTPQPSLRAQGPCPSQAAEHPLLMGCVPAVSSRDMSLRRSRNNIPRARLRMLKMSLVIVSSFILCWTPYYLLGLWHWFCPRVMEKRVSPALTHILFIFGLFNACLDPITYGLFTIPFRGGWGCPCGHGPKPQPPSPATASFRCSASSLPPKRGVAGPWGQRVPPGTGLPDGAGSCQSSSL